MTMCEVSIEMRASRVLVFATLLIALFTLAADTRPIVSQSSMDPDQIAVYRAFLMAYTKGNKPVHLNLALRTSPLSPSEGTTERCLKGISVDFTYTSSTIHEFDPQIPLSANIRLVDPDEQATTIQSNDPGKTIQQGESVSRAVDHAFTSALLTLSEVAFDKRRQYAVMAFTFRCGRKCGHGATLVFEKHNGKWKESNRECGSWIS